MTNLPLQMQDYSRFGDRRIELFDFYTICELISSTRILHNLRLHEICSIQASHAERYRLEDGRDCWERSDAAFSRLWTRRTTCNGHLYRFPDSRASPLTVTRSWSDMCMIAVQDEMSSLHNGARMEEPESCAFPTVCANSSNRGSQIRF